jgi:hypothetical protein
MDVGGGVHQAGSSRTSATSITVTITKESDPNSFQVHEITGLSPSQSIASIGSYTTYQGWSRYWQTYGTNAATYVDGAIASRGTLSTGDIVRVNAVFNRGVAHATNRAIGIESIARHVGFDGPRRHNENLDPLPGHFAA